MSLRRAETAEGRTAPFRSGRRGARLAGLAAILLMALWAPVAQCFRLVEWQVEQEGVWTGKREVVWSVLADWPAPRSAAPRPEEPVPVRLVQADGEAGSAPRPVAVSDGSAAPRRGEGWSAVGVLPARAVTPGAPPAEADLPPGEPAGARILILAAAPRARGPPAPSV